MTLPTASRPAVHRRQDPAGLAERAIAIVGAALVWAHVADEVRIGEWIALPAGFVTLALVAQWRRLRPSWRGTGALLLGLLWAAGALQYPVIPLLQGGATWQNVSGLRQLLGGVTLAVLGVRVLLSRRFARGPVEPGRW